MSTAEATTQQRRDTRPHAQALADARDFCRLFPRACYAQWQPAGSVRRRRPDVGDVDHVVVPTVADVEVGGGLFPLRERTNLLWHHLDALERGGEVSKWVRSNGTTCWGDRQRAVAFRGFKHELWTADADNFGSILAIRTGPGPYSQMLVTALQRHGYANADGHVVDNRDWRCACGWAGPDPAWLATAEARDRLDGWRVVRAPDREEEAAAHCPGCGSGRGLDRVRVPVPTEEDYFRLAGVPWVKPEDRRG